MSSFGLYLRSPVPFPCFHCWPGLNPQHLEVLQLRRRHPAARPRSDGRLRPGDDGAQDARHPHPREEGRPRQD